jgi:hypothetical protein
MIDMILLSFERSDIQQHHLFFITCGRVKGSGRINDENNDRTSKVFKILVERVAFRILLSVNKASFSNFRN